MSDAVDLSEFLGENGISDIRDTEGGAENFLREFSPKQIGSIAKYVEPISGSVSTDSVAQMFRDDTSVNAYPVEVNDHVVGVIDRRTVESVTDTALKRFFSKTVAEVTEETFVMLQAKEYIEKNLELLTEMNKKGVEYFPVFDRRTFVGIVSFHDFLNRIAQIREQDLEKAAAIQKSFFPSTIDLKSIKFSINCWNRMANTLGGDFYQAFPLSENEALICCCDVSGKNVAASLLTIAATSFFETRRKMGQMKTDPVDILCDFDDYLSDVIPVGNFITGVFVYVDTKRHIFQLFNCGHTTAYLVYADRSSEDQKPRIGGVDPKLPPFGLRNVKTELLNSKEQKDPKKKPYLTMGAKKGIHIGIYTDGLSDMVNNDGSRYEDAKVKSLFLNLYPVLSEKVSEKITSAVDSYIGNTMLPDDITVIDIRFDSILFS